MKKTLCGFAFILFGIAMLLAEITDPYIFIINSLPFDYIGIVCSVIGLFLVIKNTKK
jgi:hypothetical protein